MGRERTWNRLAAPGTVVGAMHDEKRSLIKANLRGANLSGADLKGTDLSGADLGGANLSAAKLNGVDLKAAKLKSAILIKADLSGADLSGADLRRANLRGANLRGANLRGANLMESVVTDVNFNLADLRDADITGIMFWGVSITSWRIDGIKARYIYFCRESGMEKERYKRNFAEKQFEDLFKSIPTVELIFQQRLNPKELLVLNVVIEEIQKQYPDLGVKMSEMSTRGSQTCISIEMEKDEYSEITSSLILKELEEVFKKGIPLSILTQKISDMIPASYSVVINSSTPQQETVVFYADKMEFLVSHVNVTGAKYGGLVTRIGKASTNLIFKKYEDNQQEVDRYFRRLKSAFGDDEILIKQVDRVIMALQKGKNDSSILSYWEPVKESSKTNVPAGRILTSIACLLNLA